MLYQMKNFSKSKTSGLANKVSPDNSEGQLLQKKASLGEFNPQ